MITNPHTGTTIDEIADGIYRISTPIPPSQAEGGFSFNQYLIRDDEPMLFHAGLRGLFPAVREAIETVLAVETLRWIGVSHFESDECGALNEFLTVAPNAAPVSSRVGALVSLNDFAIRPARALADGETLTIGSREIEWIDAPHLPHNWETGYIFDRRTETLFCGDLFAHAGADTPALTSGDVLGASEQFRIDSAKVMPDVYSYARGSAKSFDRMIATNPRTLAIMHGSAWSDGSKDGAAKLLTGLKAAVAA